MTTSQRARACHETKQTCSLAAATDGSSDLDSHDLSGDRPRDVVDFFGCGTRLSMNGSALHSGLPARDNSCRAGSHVSIQRISDLVGDPRACTAFCAGSCMSCEGDVVCGGIAFDGSTHQWIFLLQRHSLGIHNNDLWTSDILRARGC
jgi:hypothetical protein